MNEKVENEQRKKGLFVVGLGASAGGLDPLKHFFKSLPEETGMAFIVIVHLSPEHKSNLAELLQMHSPLKILQVNERTRIEQDHVYVIPPKKLLALDGDYIELSDSDKMTRHATVDLLFRSLGEVMGEHSATVILSGSGSDGMEGIKTVKERGGFIIAQDPGEADYSDMPKNAINTGLVDMVLPVDSMANELFKYREAIIQGRFDGDGDGQKEALKKILSKLHDQTGHDFSNYKQPSILRRIHRRMHVARVESLSEYASCLNDQPEEADKLFKNLLISVTRFFRDRKAFDALEHEIIPKLFREKGADSQVRVWVPGCATGEEAYSIAILLHEYSRNLGAENLPAIQIFATDIDEEAIKVGRRGRYPKSVAANLTPERLNRYFDKSEHYFQLKKEISDMVLFTPHDLLKDPPFSKLDMIACRNLLIYLNRELQAEVFKMFHFALLPDRWLFLGLADSQIEAAVLFSPVNKEFGLFQRSSASITLPRLPGMPLRVDRIRHLHRAEDGAQDKPNFQEIQLNFLLQLYSLQCAVINENYEVIYSTDGIQQYLKYGGGQPSLNILEMVKPGLKNALQSLLFQLEKNDSSSSLRKILASKNEGEKKTELQIHRLEEPGIRENYFHVVFREVEPGRTTRADKDRADEDEMVETLERELEFAREQIRIVLDKNKASSGKLRASNEELQSMNEELQSTAEELETSLEELHSVNEELKCLNRELEGKIEELRRSNSDLKNLMEAIDIGILFVDREFCVQLFTSSLTNIFNLISEDHGRPIEHITHRLRYESLINDLINVRDNHNSIKRVVKSLDGQWYNMQLRPYRSLENSVEGVVLTFIDITQLREAEEILKHQKQHESLASLGLYAMERQDLPSILHRASQQICMILETNYALLYTLDEENNTLQLNAYTGLTIDDEKEKEIRNDEKSDAGYAFRRKDPVIVKNYIDEERFHISPLVERFDIESGFHVRITGSANEVYGVLSIYSGKKLTILEEDLNYVQVMASLIGMSIERKKAKRILEETNKALTKEIQKSEQYQREILNTSIAERWQLGGFLHDNLAQILASVKIMLADIHQNLPGGNKDIKESINALSGVIDEAMASIRDLTHDIIPIDIEEEGVEHAFRFLIRQTQKLHNVNCKLDTDGSIGKIKNRKLATNIYHVVQEAIKNAAVHGKAKNIEISMMESKGDIILKVIDDGAGLLYVPNEMKGKGLRIMKHRMELLGGTLDLKEKYDTDKKGAVLTCTIPLEDLYKREK